MGGCRCSFRECKVATSRYPNMHFFHFPLKDKERLEKWLAMAAAENMRGKSAVYQKNRVICARHFRDECFMNYKKDRLVQTAVPTLMRFGRYTALDYELDEPTIVSLNKPTMSHLISPPDFKDPLEFDSSEEEITDLDLGTGTTEHVSISISPENSLKRPNSLKGNPGVVRKKPKILNKNANRQEKSKHTGHTDEEGESQFEEEENITIVEKLTTDGDEDGSLWLPDADPEVPNPHFIFSKKTDDEYSNSEYILEQIDDLEAETEEISASDAKMVELREELNNVKEKLSEAERENQSRQNKLKQVTMSRDSVRNALDFMRQERDKLKEENEQLKKEIGSLKIEKKQITENIQQQNTISHVSTTADAIREAKPVNAVLTKDQLFKGIKKYLSATMVALLRMEMFGSAERSWKPDEMRTSVDLWQLGESVYRYFTDEWRLRLPAISEVRKCSLENSTLDQDEEL